MTSKGNTLPRRRTYTRPILRRRDRLTRVTRGIVVAVTDGRQAKA